MTKVFETKATVEQWDNDYYHPISLKLYDQAVSDMLKKMEVPSQATVLDAGCGPGVHSIRAAKAGYSVCAIDISETMLEEAKQRTKISQVEDKITFAQKDLTKLDFPDNSFSYVFSWGVIIHIPDIEAALNELTRIISPGGKLALYLTNKTAFDHKIESLMRFILKKPLTNVEHTSIGEGVYYDLNDEKLWLWKIDADGLVDYLSSKGFALQYRRTGEFTQIQWRLKGIPRKILLHLNNLAYTLKVSPSLSSTNLYIFEKKIT